MARRKRPIEPLDPAEVDRLLKACGRGPSGVRNRALLAVMYYAGLRRGEAIDLDVRDVRVSAGEIIVRNGKGGKQRTVALPTGGMALVERWLAVRSEGKGRAAFCTISAHSYGRRLQPAYLHQLIKRLALRAGLTKRVFPHLLRHSHAAHLVESGVHPNLIKDQLGHSSLGTTTVYLEEINPRPRIESINSAWT